MTNQYDLFVKLSMEQCHKNDYYDRNKIDLHNRASKELQSLKRSMSKTDCTQLLRDLLLHPDARVKLNAASLCIEMSILFAEASEELDRIISCSEDASICFSAKMLGRKLELIQPTDP